MTRGVRRSLQRRGSWEDTGVAPCACSQLRRTARAASAIYDRHLAPGHLTVTQYAVLVNVGRAGRISRSDLADHLGMERTTLTRDLQPLERQQLVRTTTGRDRRERLLQLTPRGRARLEAAYPLWLRAQRQFTSEIGTPGVARLRSALARVVSKLGLTTVAG